MKKKNKICWSNWWMFWCFYNFVNAALIYTHLMHWLPLSLLLLLLLTALHSHQCKLHWHVHTEAHTECVASFNGQVKFFSHIHFQIHSGFVCFFFSLLRYSYLILSFCCSILFDKKNKRYLWTSAYICFRKWKTLPLSLSGTHTNSLIGEWNVIKIFLWDGRFFSLVFLFWFINN